MGAILDSRRTNWLLTCSRMGKSDFCCAHGCVNNRKRNPELKFYRIPKEERRRRAWLQRIRRVNFTPSDNTRLCPVHFVGGAKSDDPSDKAFVPSIFIHSHSLIKTSRSSKNSLKTDMTQYVEIPKPKRRRLELHVSYG